MNGLDIEEKEPAGLTYPKVTDAERSRRREAELAKGPPPCAACGKQTTFDPAVVGLTCGGLWLKGWYMCKDQHGSHAGGLAEVTDAPTWTTAKGGRSVDIGTGRIRFGAVKVESGERLDVVGLMTRIARLPDLERLGRAAIAWDASDDEDRVAELEELLAAIKGLRPGLSNGPERTREGLRT